MKPLLCLTVIVIFGCKHKPFLTPPKPPASDTTQKLVETEKQLPVQRKTGYNKYHTNKDTVYIPTLYGNMQYSREEFNDIIDNYPELYSDNVTHPDTTFTNSRKSVLVIDSLGNENQISFGCEVCQDGYYGLYAWFLKNKNGIAKHAARRKKLIDIYSKINRLFCILHYSGTYYAHQFPRIEGYAEYDIYRYIHKKALFVNPPDFRQQKAQFISALKENIGDEDINLITDTDQRERLLEMRNAVSYLNKEITDYFFLENARAFRNYNYE